MAGKKEKLNRILELKEIKNIYEDEKLLKMFEDVKDIRASIRNVISTSGYRIENGFVVKKDNNIKEKESNIIEVKQENNLEKYIDDKLILQMEHIKKYIDNEIESKLKDIKLNNIQEKHSHYIDTDLEASYDKASVKTIRVSDRAYEELDKFLKNNEYLKNLTKTKALSVLIVRIVEFFK